jgi:anti-sigma factor RsiW
MKLFGRNDVIACRRAVELLAGYLDGALPKADLRRLERHLAGCGHCTEYLEQLRASVRLSQAIPAPEIDDGTQSALAELYRRWKLP